MKKLLSCIISAGIGLWFATSFIAGVSIQIYPNSAFFGIPITAKWQLLILLGIILGLLNYFVKPILNLITLPLRIITLGFFGIVINMGLIWILDSIFTEFHAPLLFPLLWTTLIVFGLNVIISKILVKKD